MPHRTHLVVAFATSCAVLGGALGATRLYHADYTWNLWTDRDLVRASQPWTELPVAGAELNRGDGGRVPGGGYHLLLKAPLELRGEPADAWRGLYALHLLGGLGLALLAVRRWGALAGAAAVLAAVVGSDAARTMEALWNPTAAPGLVALSILPLYRALKRDDPRWLGPTAALLGLAGHAHLTALLWGGWTTLGLALVRPRLLMRAIPWLLVGLLLPYVPWILTQIAEGGVDLSLLVGQPTGSKIGRGDVLTNAWRGLAALSPTVSLRLGDHPVLTGLLGPVAWGLAGYGTWRAWRDGPQDALTRIVSVPLFAAAFGPAMLGDIAPEDRYFLAAVPGFVWLQAAGVARLPAVAAVPAVALLALPVAAEWRHQHAPSETDPFERADSLHRAVAKIGDALRADGKDARTAEVVGRTVMVQVTGDRAHTSAPLPLDLYLMREGDEFPGSLPPPCYAVVLTDGSRVDALRTALGRPDLTVLDTVSEQPPIVRYTLDGLCPSTMTNRYLPTPTEQQARALLWRTQPKGEARRIPAPHDGARVVVRLPAAAEEHDTSQIVLDLVPEADGLAVTLHSNQLRGGAYNLGWFVTGLVGDLALVLHTDAGEVLWPLADRPVGRSHLVAPLHRAATPLPPGTRSLSLRATPWRVPRAPMAPWTEGAPGATTTIDLGLTLADGRLLPAD